MKILITGGAGFIGSHLSEKYLKKGSEVTAIDDLSTGSFENIRHLMPNKMFKFVHESVFNKMVLDRLISEADVVIHLAATVGVELIIKDQVRVIENNIHGTDIILKSCNRYKKKVLIASTSEVYGKNEKTPFNESDDFLMGATINARWSYAATKAIDEFLALAYFKEYELPAIIVRLFNTVGPRQTGQYGMVIPRFVNQALKNEDLTVYGSGDQTRCFCHVNDVCEALMGLVDCKDAIGEIINIGNNEEITINDLALKVIEISKSKSIIKLIPYNEAYDSGFEDMLKRVPDIKKANRLIGFNPKNNLDYIIKDVIEYMNNTGRI